MTESRVVDSEFQNRKYDDESRINRILEISVGKQFSTGSLKSFGCNYQELKKHCVDLYTTKYRRMVLVVCSAGENEEMKKIIEENFSLDLDKLVYMDRKCLICSGKEECEVTNNSETKHKAEDGNTNDHAPGRKDVSSEVSQSVPCNDLCTSKDMGQKFDSNLRITKLYKYKPIFPKKRVIVSISLPSELVQYHNMYDSLVYFFSKEDHSSLLYTLRKNQLIFNGTVNTITTQRETMLCFDFIVLSTDVYNVITDEINRYFQIYKDTQSMASYYSKIERDVNWQLYEDEDMRIHVVDCAEKILRSKVLFTDLMCEHECKNLVMEECTVILVDDKYECEKVADDEYELRYEKIECAEEFGRRLKGDMSSEADLVDNDNGNHKKDVAMCADEINANQHTETEKGVVDPHHNRVTQKKEKFDRNNRRFGIKNIVGSVIKDKDINTILKIIKCGESRLVFIKDSFTSSKTVIHLFLRYRTSILDVINLAELVGQMNVLYNHILRSNAIAITHHICHNGILFEISGLNPFFVLINILNFEGILGMMSSKIDKLNVLNDVKVSLEDEMYESGYKRTSNSIKNVYIEGYQTIEKEYEIVKEMIEQWSIQENTDENGVADEMRCGMSACKAGTGGEINRFIPFNEAQSVLLIVNGYSNEECYHEVFRKICARMQGKGPALEIGIREEYGSTKDVFSVLQGENKRTDCNMVGEKKDLCHINSPKCINDILAKYRSKSDCLVFNKMINARMTIKARNNSNSVFFRIGEGIKSLAICKILVHLMNEKLFTSLRTEQSLGYVVYCSYKSIKNMHFLFFSVQSDQDVLFNIFEFIEDFDIRLECFESLKNEIMEKMKSRAQVTKHYFNIFYCSFDNVDTFRHDVCNCIDSVTVDDLKRALKEGELCVIKAEEYQESES